MDAERELVAHYVDASAMEALLNLGVNDTLFYNPDHKRIFLRALRWYESSLKDGKAQGIPKEILEQEFKQYFDGRGWPKAHTVSEVVEALKKAYTTGQTKITITELYQEMVTEPQEALTKMVNALSEIQRNTATKERSENYGERFDNRMDEYHRRSLDGGDGYPLAFDKVTEMTGGILPQELAVVIAFTGIGKTWALCQCALEAAKTGVKVFFASLEVRKQVIERLDCIVSGVRHIELRQGKLNPAEWKKLNEAREIVRDGYGKNIMIDAPENKAERSVAEIYLRAKHQGAQMVIGDQLTWVANLGKFRDRFEEMADVVQQVADMNRSLGFASIWASQFNRKSQDNKRKKGDLHNIGLSSNIEQVVDWAFGLTRDKELEEREQMLLYVMKARRHRQAEWILDWKFTEETSFSVNREYNDDEFDPTTVVTD